MICGTAGMWVRVGREQYHGTVTAPLCLELQWGRVQPQENQLRVGTALYTSCSCNHRTKKEEYQLLTSLQEDRQGVSCSSP